MKVSTTMISVCIPTYNGEKYIRQQLESILKQLDDNDEVIISDDSSTDNTVALIKSLNDKRINIFPNNTFRSPIYNLENALKKATGDYIFLSDQDDIWYEHKVKTIISYFQEYNTIVSDCKIIDKNNQVLIPSFFEINQSGEGFLKNISKNSYLGCCMAFDRKILTNVLPFPPNIAMHDIWIGLITELTGKPFFLNEQLVGYRKHESNFSPTSANNSKFSLWFKINYRIIFVFHSILRYIKIRLR